MSSSGRSIGPSRNRTIQRVHSEQQIAQLGKSIDTFGFTFEILVDEDDYVLAGHGKLLAARFLGLDGLDQVPVSVITGLTDAEKRLYMIADNQLALNATWDEKKLKVLLAALEEELGNLDLTGLPSPGDRSDLGRFGPGAADLG